LYIPFSLPFSAFSPSNRMGRAPAMYSKKWSYAWLVSLSRLEL
jgi:hypothetical protein